MDNVNLSYTISGEDLVGVLKTILTTGSTDYNVSTPDFHFLDDFALDLVNCLEFLTPDFLYTFLESIDFNASSEVLRDECFAKGLTEIVTSPPAKVLVLHPTQCASTSSGFRFGQVNQGNQTDFPMEVKYSLLQTDANDANTNNKNGEEQLYLYCRDVTNFSNRSSNNNISESGSVPIIVPVNTFNNEKLDVDVNNGEEIAAHSVVVKESSENENMNSNNNSCSKRCPNTIETEMPSKSSRNKQQQQLRKTFSNPIIKINTNASKPKREISGESLIKLKPEEIDPKELKRKFHQLQNEHQKLMGVATELTLALQTHILGQSDNINSMLNNCKIIYPDLFHPLNCQRLNSANGSTTSKNNIMVYKIATEENTGGKKSTSSNSVLANRRNPEDKIIIDSNKDNNKLSCKDLEQTRSEEKSKENVPLEKSKSFDKAQKQKSNFKLTRPQSSTIIVLTTKTTEDQGVNTKISWRQQSSRSCDESLITTNNYNNENSESSDEKIQNDVVLQIEFNSVEQQTEEANEPPEIFVTTEKLDQIEQRGSTCKYSHNCKNTLNSSFHELDFKKLKKDMLSGEDGLKMGLVQALRWRITKSGKEARDQVVSSYTRHDLLGLHSAPNNCGQSTMESYLCPNKETPHLLQEGMARLINTFASLTLGRDYLCQDDDLMISLLIPLVIDTHYSKTNLNRIARDMLIATLQKLSLRHRQRVRMIDAGLVEYLLYFLSTKHQKLTEYCMEYTSALFMNLCLHPDARKCLHQSVTDVVSLLADLLNTKHKSSLPYINGAMYSLLGDPVINKEAQRLEFHKLIEYHIEQTEGDMQRQLQYILKLHLSNGTEKDCGCDSSIEPENEVDLLEPELDGEDSFRGLIEGEELLAKYQKIFSVYGSQVYDAHFKCLCRPTTPIPRYLLSNHELQNTTEQTTEQTNKSETKQENDILQIHPRTTPKSAKPQEDETRPKRASASEPITNIKTAETNRKLSKSEQPSRPDSPDMWYCEETKQCYYQPSARNGIFESHKSKNPHRAPASFTRTIPMACRIDHSPLFYKSNYSKSSPLAPRESSSAQTPPYALDYPTCYRENCANHEMTHFHLNCTKRNKYPCNCYNALKGYVEQSKNDNVNSNDVDESSASNLKPGLYRPVNIQAACCNCGNLQNFDTEAFEITNNSEFNRSTPLNSNQDVDTNGGVADFSYDNLAYTINAESKPEHVCPNAGHRCQCYDFVFQSRPKILRTPP